MCGVTHVRRGKGSLFTEKQLLLRGDGRQQRSMVVVQIIHLVVQLHILQQI